MWLTGFLRFEPNFRNFIQVSGDLFLSLEQLDINLSIEYLDRTKPFLSASVHGADADVDAAFEAIQQHHIFLVEGGAELRKLNEFHTKVKQGEPSTNPKKAF